MTLRDLFKDHVASTAFCRIDGEQRIVGRYGQVSFVDGIFDIWLIGSNQTPLSTKKIRSIRDKLPVDCVFLELTHEGYTQVCDVEVVRQILTVLGIKKRVKRSPETIKAHSDRLSRCRKQREAE